MKLVTTENFFILSLNYQVLKAVFQLVPTNNLSTIVMDFEAAFWRSVQKLRPDVKQRGCLFHYTQAVWRKVQELGKLIVSCSTFTLLIHLFNQTFTVYNDNSTYSVTRLIFEWQHLLDCFVLIA
jgi:hypothetical protein